MATKNKHKGKHASSKKLIKMTEQEAKQYIQAGFIKLQIGDQICVPAESQQESTQPFEQYSLLESVDISYSANSL